MRIGTLELFRQGVNAMLDQQTQVVDTQLQLSTGKRINKPSDDPTGAARLLGLSESLKVAQQYQKNADYARSRLELEDADLASVGDALQRVRELTVRALNDTNGAPDRAAIAQEVRQLNNEILALANRKDANGEYIFGGFHGRRSRPTGRATILIPVTRGSESCRSVRPGRSPTAIPASTCS